jgi:hypothetical protein
MDLISIPMKQSVVTALAPVTTNGAKAADYLNMALALRVYVIVTLVQAVGHATVVTLRQATDNSGTNLKDLGKDIPIWADEDVAASDILVKQDDGVSHTVENDVTNKKIIFQVEGDDLDMKNDFTHLTVGVSSSSQAANLVNIDYIVESRVPGETLTD